ncbi:hypothetical protein PCANC_24911 [Puccinia coronata f. sp. avenae]|uniref:Uncharacterized protein n=1 Tax=Puccinia coronata f. sp. avenae TaxID=200324 RepID=A0A2N5U3N9_9BASI|nr:hypothetical protein PCANC_24911 [Puccinia coronata f. sp. avenae]
MNANLLLTQLSQCQMRTCSHHHRYQTHQTGKDVHIPLPGMFQMDQLNLLMAQMKPLPSIYYPLFINANQEERVELINPTAFLYLIALLIPPHELARNTTQYRQR